jgi:hypothetical protein
MSAHNSKNAVNGIRRVDREPVGGDQPLNNTFLRLRSALLEDRLASMDLTDESAGSDPYNSGTHRALGKSTVWNKRSR